MPITTVEDLEAQYGQVSAAAETKVLPRLDTHCRAFIAASPFFLLATSDGTRLDVSPKGDPAGSVIVPDDNTLLIADRPGNNRLDGLRNILRHDAVSVIFLIPTIRESLRIQGRATIHAEDEILDQCLVKGRRPITVTRVAVDTAFLHCANAFLRSGLWQPETWPTERPIAPMNRILQDHCAIAIPPETEDEMLNRYAEALY